MGDRMLKRQSAKITNRLGLHARAAGRLASLASQFNATIALEKGRQVASTDSIMELMMLTAGSGDTVTITTTGPESAGALQAVASFIQNGFGEGMMEGE